MARWRPAQVNCFFLLIPNGSSRILQVFKHIQNIICWKRSGLLVKEYKLRELVTDNKCVLTYPPQTDCMHHFVEPARTDAARFLQVVKSNVDINQGKWLQSERKTVLWDDEWPKTKFTDIPATQRLHALNIELTQTCVAKRMMRPHSSASLMNFQEYSSKIYEQ